MSADRSTVGGMLDWAACHPRIGVRVVDASEGEVFASWADVRERAAGLAGGLQGLGLKPGDRVGLIFPTGMDFLATYFAATLAGMVPVPLYPPARLGRLVEYHARTARMLRAVQARVVLADSRVRRILGPSILAARTPLGCLTVGDLPSGQLAAPRIDAEALALVQFSSGTTADPKPVALSHRALVTQARLINGFWPGEPGGGDSGVSWLPLYHDMGLIGCILPALERPGPLTLIPPEAFIARPALWLRTISRYRATLSPAPNFAYALCTRKVRDEEMEGVDLSCWRVALNGAETVVPGVLRAFADRFSRWGFRADALTPVYGLSEAGLAVTFSTPGRGVATRRFDRSRLAGGHAVESSDGLEVVSVGRPLPGFAVVVAADGGRRLADGRVGRVVITGPSLMSGYLGKRVETERVMRDGWLDTGDRGFLLDGELYLTGREKDVLIVNGRNYLPAELEHAVGELPGARAGCVVVGSWLPEGAATEHVVVLVETARGARKEALDGLAGRCREALLVTAGLRPEAVAVLAPGTLPRTSSGKVRRQEAIRQWLAGELQPPRAVTARVLLGAMAHSTLAFARARLSTDEGDSGRE